MVRFLKNWDLHDISLASKSAVATVFSPHSFFIAGARARPRRPFWMKFPQHARVFPRGVQGCVRYVVFSVGGRPSLGRSAGVMDIGKTLGVQFFQCTTSVRGWPLAKVPTFIFKHDLPNLSRIS